MNHLSLSRRLIVPLVLAFAGAVSGCDSAPAGGQTGADSAVVGTPDAGSGDAGGNPGGGFTGGPGTTPGGGGENHPPSLYKIGDKEVPIGETLVVDLAANDPDGDTLVFSVFGDLPDGAKFSKPNKQLVWTPAKAGVSAFLTFVVSDGELFDRETVELRSVTEKSNHAPVLEPLGDQAVAPGVKVDLRLEASDVDGDALTFGMDGEVPAGATLDASTGQFGWTPTTADDGSSYRMRFTASDGQADDSQEVKLLVGKGKGSPPVFVPVGTQKIGPGQTLQFEVEATDPDGEALTYSTKGALPAGASFKPTIRLFSWQPAASQAGQAFTVNFQATDGTFTTVMPVDIVVGSPSGGASCSKDALEPNDSAATASKVGAGTWELSLCDVGDSYDVDWFAITLSPGEKLIANTTFDASEGDIELDLYDPKAGEEPLTQSSGVGDEEEVSFTSQAGGAYLLAVYGVGQEVFKSSYALAVSIEETGGGQPAGCVDDDGEDDDTLATAGSLPSSGSVKAHICPNDIDAWKVAVACGQSMDVALTGFLPGDLDLYVFDPKSPSTPVAQAVTAGPKESLSLGPASAEGELVLVVAGYPPEKTDAPYTLSATTKGDACKADFAEPNDTKGAALPLLAGDTVEGLRLCCDDDWFAIDLAAGDTLQAQVAVTGSVALELWPAGAAAVPLAKAPGGSGSASISHTVAAKGTYSLRIGPGSAGSSYSLSVEVKKGSAGCTGTSCPTYQVCNQATGACVSDYCTKDAECPLSHLCIDTYCTAACESDVDCQTGYRCKAFPQGNRCGIEGSGPTGDNCSWFSDCASAAACLFQDDGGYCAQVGCASYLDCPADAECVTPPGGGEPICARWCIGGEACSGAFTCTSWKDVDGLTTEVCLP